MRYALLLILLPSMAAAQPEIRLNKVFYKVAGHTMEDLWADVMLKTPVEQNGRKFAAFTRWHVSWRFWWQYDGKACDISKVETKLDVTYTLPQIDRSSGMPDGVIDRWEQYYSALFEHEQGHKDFGARASSEIAEKISQMGPRENCSLLETDANEIGKQVIERYTALEKEYDRSTNHGMNTGAVFSLNDQSR